MSVRTDLLDGLIQEARAELRLVLEADRLGKDISFCSWAGTVKAAALAKRLYTFVHWEELELNAGAELPFPLTPVWVRDFRIDAMGGRVYDIWEKGIVWAYNGNCIQDGIRLMAKVAPTEMAAWCRSQPFIQDRDCWTTEEPKP